jgi:hypothetical protein
LILASIWDLILAAESSPGSKDQTSKPVTKEQHFSQSPAARAYAFCGAAREQTRKKPPLYLGRGEDVVARVLRRAREDLNVTLKRPIFQRGVASAPPAPAPLLTWRVNMSMCLRK